MAIGEKIQTVSKKLSDVYGSAYTRGYSRGHDVGYEEGFEKGGVNGYEAGKRFAEQECQSMHYSTSILGSGTRRLTADIPFKPDVISIYSTHSYSGQVANCFKGFLMDLRTCGQYMGNILYCLGKDTISTAMISPVSGIRFMEYSAGSFAFELPSNMFPGLIWPTNVRYTVVAAKYPRETVAELLREQIDLLPDTVPAGSTGTLNYYGESIWQYMSPQEWESLIATKPNWTFVLG